MIFCPSWALNWNKSIVIVIVIGTRKMAVQQEPRLGPVEPLSVPV